MSESLKASPKGAGIVPICRSAANLKKRVGSAEMVVEKSAKEN
jgi:hypothetical protein